MAFGFGQNEIGEDNRIARNIVSADVQHPGDIVECGQDMHLGTVLFHLFADFCKTVSSGLAGIFGIKNPDRFCRKCWAVGPDFTDQVTSIGEKTLRKCLFQCLTEHFIDNIFSTESCVRSSESFALPSRCAIQIFSCFCVTA